MINTIYVKVNAANPSLALKPAVSFISSPSSIKVADVPKKIGKWKITNVYFRMSYPDNNEITTECVLDEGLWIGTIAGSSKAGSVSSGFQIIADGLDEVGQKVNGYVLGFGDVEVIGNSLTTVDGNKWNIKLCEEVPDNPSIGDLICVSNNYKIWNGTEWMAWDSHTLYAGYGIKIDNGEISISASIPTKTSQLENDAGFLSSHQSLEGYATEEWVVSKNYLTSHQSLSDYYKKSETSSSAEISNALEDAGKVKSVNGDIGDVSVYVPTKVSELTNDSGYLTSHQSLSDYATQGWVKDQHYLSTHQSLSAYATHQWVENKRYALSDDVKNNYQPKGSYLTSHQSLSNYATQSWVENKRYALSNDVKNNFQPKGNYLTSHQSLEGYATQSWVESKHYLTSHQSLSDYATQSWVENKKYALSSDVKNNFQLKGNYLTSHQSLTAYATQKWVEDKHYLSSHQSLSNYYSKSETSSAIQINVALSNVGSVKSVNGQTGDVSVYVPTKVSELTNDKGYLTSHQSLSAYATQKWVEDKKYATSADVQNNFQKKGNYALSVDVQNNFQVKGNYLTSVPSGYATESWVENKHYLTSHQSLSNYYKKSETSSAYQIKTALQNFGSVKSVNGQTGDVSVYVPTKTSELQNDSGFLTSHQNLSAYATQQWVNDKRYALSDVVSDNYQKKGNYALCADVSNNYQRKGNYALSNDVKNNYQVKGDYLTAVPSYYATQAWVQNQNYLTAHQSLTGYYKKSETSSATQLKTAIDNAGKVKSVNGKTGDISVYVPTKVSEFTNDAGYLTSHQSLADYATQSWVQDQHYLSAHQSLSDYYEKSETSSATEIKAALADAGKVKSVNGQVGDVSVYVPTKISELTNDSGYLTSHQSLSDYATQDWVQSQNYLTSHQSLSDYALSSDVENNFQPKGEYTTSSDVSSMVSSTLDFYGLDKIKVEKDRHIWIYTDALKVDSASNVLGYANYSKDNYGYQFNLYDYINEFCNIPSGRRVAQVRLTSIDFRTNETEDTLIGLKLFDFYGNLILKTEPIAMNTNYRTTLVTIPKESQVWINPSSCIKIMPYVINSESGEEEFYSLRLGYTTDHDYTTKWYRIKDASGSVEQVTSGTMVAGGIYFDYMYGGDDVPTRVLTDGDISSIQDLSNYYKKSETSSAVEISTALDGAGKVKSVNGEIGDVSVYVPINVSELSNDAKYISQQALSGYATQDWVKSKNYLTSHQSLTGYYTKSETSSAIQIAAAIKQSGVQSVNGQTGDVILDIPTKISELENDAGYITCVNNTMLDMKFAGTTTLTGTTLLSGTTYSNGINLTNRYNSDTYTLQGSSSGDLTWNGHTIIDKDGNIQGSGSATSAEMALRLGDDDVGSICQPIYLSAGHPVEISYLTCNTTGNASTATSAIIAYTADKLGTATVGSSVSPIYLSSGVPAQVTSLTCDTTGNAATSTVSETTQSISVLNRTEYQNMIVKIVDTVPSSPEVGVIYIQLEEE